MSKVKAHNTIYDIARIAGVSGKTVSRVVNNEAGVGVKTRARIEKIIAELGYHPHSGARSMRSHTRECLGVFFPAPLEVVPINPQQTHWLFMQLYRIFGMRGKFISFDLNPRDPANGYDYARGLWRQRCWGCVLHGPVPVDDPTVRRIHESGQPYVAFNRQYGLPEMSYASVDYEEGGYLSTKHLLDRGHKRVGMLQSLKGFQAGEERRRGYLRAHEEAGLPVEEALIRPVTFEHDDQVNAIHRILQDRATTALVSTSATEDAEALYEGALRAGRRPGKDFELVVWTYTANATVLPEACAHVWLPLREASAEGLQLLAEWFDEISEGPIQVLYRPTLYEVDPGAPTRKPNHLFDTFR